MKYPEDLSQLPPAITLALVDFLAESMYDLILVNDFSSMTAVIKLVKSSTEPMLKLFIPAVSFFLTATARLEGIYALDAAEHFWP